MDILLKYRPSSLNEFVGNKLQIQKLKTAHMQKKHVLLLGPPGCGKTLLIDLFCSEKNANVLDVHKDNICQITPFLNNKTIQSFFDDKSKIIVFDNIDVLITNDKLTCSFLTGITKQTECFVVCSCNSNEEKKLTDLKKNFEVIKLDFPSSSNTFAYIIQILDKENIEYDPEDVLELCKKYKGNIRETFNQLLHGSRNEQCSSFKNLNSIETVSKLLSCNIDTVDIKYIINTDANVTSCMVFENVPEEIHYNRSPKDMKLSISLYREIADRYLESTILEDYMCKNHEWSMWDMVYTIRFYGTNLVLNKNLRIEVPKEHTIRCSQLLSKTSHKQIMNKKIRSFSEGISMDNKLLLANIVTKKSNEKEWKKRLNKEQCNFINTYAKYFL